ncbi:GNAT family N-acetyltransferase [Paenibacillus sp. P26]|nr:GNAT family N-acetyltransferase [Paenibacillus sp. P26]UUZ97688.1 GNAT family N-acetyltransferase [Paenibacillus sp. P25]
MGQSGDGGFVAETAGGKALGAAWYRLTDESAPGYGFVDRFTPELSVAVLPEHTGRGIGSRSLQALIRQAQAEGYPGLSLSVDPANQALQLYRRLGFERCGESGTSWTMLLRFR